MKTVLVTGANGFIAKHLLLACHQEHWQITAAVRNNLRQLPSIPLKKIAVGDIDGNTDWHQCLQGIETVIHLAARAHILKDNSPNPEAEFLRVNTLGTANLVRQSIAAGVQQFIFISSVGAMASLSEQILTEKFSCNPDTPYGQSKLKAEQILIQLATNSNMTWTILRPTLVYGAENPGNMERLIKLVKLGLPLPLASIKNRRSFVFVGNLVSAILACVKCPQATNQIFLVSDDEQLSTPEMIVKIGQHIDKYSYLCPLSPNILLFAGFCGDIVQKLTKKTILLNTKTINRMTGSLFVDNSHIKRTLNWQLPFTIDEGLQETLKK